LLNYPGPAKINNIIWAPHSPTTTIHLGLGRSWTRW